MAAFTVTAAQSVATFNGILLRLRVLTGIAASPIGASAEVTNGGVSITLAANVTTTKAGSLVYGGLIEVGPNAFTGTGQPSTTITDSVTDAPDGAVYGTCRTAAATVTPGAVLVGSTLSEKGGAAVLEILPSGTITEDPSSPASVSTITGTTITTAAFNPPLGSLLVAMVSADASAATVIGLTDTSGLGLTWTQQVVAQSAGAAYAAVWTAPMPPAPAAQGGGVYYPYHHRGSNR